MRRMGVWLLAWGVAVACSTSGGTSSSSSSSSGGGGMDAGSADAAVAPDAGSCIPITLDAEPTCNTCMEQNCCITASACEQDATCVAYVACVAACTTVPCAQQCQTQHAAAVWLWSGMVTCQRNNCGAPCGVTAGQCGGIGLTTTQCNTCVRANCCDQALACAQQDACDAFIYQCLDHRMCAGPDSACGQACQAEYPQSADTFAALQGCARSSCPVDCAGL